MIPLKEPIGGTVRRSLDVSEWGCSLRRSNHWFITTSVERSRTLNLVHVMGCPPHTTAGNDLC
jgi:hypothetical protein